MNVGALIWLIAAIVLAGAELLVGEFTLLMLGLAALGTSGAALIGLPLWAEILTFAVIAVLLLIFLKPALKRHFVKPLVLDTTPQALVGAPAEVLEEVSGTKGQIRLDGSIWSARSLDPTQKIEVGESVNVVSIDGSTAVVWKES